MTALEAAKVVESEESRVSSWAAEKAEAEDCSRRRLLLLVGITARGRNGGML
jgi:hypothetical protein